MSSAKRPRAAGATKRPAGAKQKSGDQAASSVIADEIEYLNINEDDEELNSAASRDSAGARTSASVSANLSAAAGAGPLRPRASVPNAGAQTPSSPLQANDSEFSSVGDHIYCLGSAADDEPASRSESTWNLVGPALNGRLTKNLAFAVLASAVGSSFQHGYNGGVVNAPAKLICQFINETYHARHQQWATDAQVDLIFAIVVSVFCVGGCMGALLTVLVADRLGRKEGLLYNNLIVLVACPLMASAKTFASYELLILGRLVIGVNAGLNAGLAPLYLNEISPVELRGALGTIYQLVITISILLSNVFGLPALLGTEELWPLLFALPLAPAAFMLAALPHCSESPKHLLLNQARELQAQQALAWFRQTSDVQEEMDELRVEHELGKAQPPVTLAEMLRQRRLRRPLTISVVIMLSQQLSGINAVLFYSTSIFRSAGLSAHAAISATLGMSLVNVLMTVVSLFLVDRAGRRTLHMTGLMGMAVTCLVLAICLGRAPPDELVAPTGDGLGAPTASLVAVGAVYLFIVMFASGPGSIPWFLVAELFPSSARPLASSIAVAVNWLANFTVTLCFLPLSNVLHGYTFVVFAVLLVAFYLFTYYRVPETRGATAEEISALFVR